MISGIQEVKELGYVGGRALVLMTGGKDSATCFEIARYHHNEVVPVYFNFGQENQTRNSQFAVRYVYDVEHSDSGADVLPLESIDMSDFFFGKLVNREVDKQGEFIEAFNHPGSDDGGLEYVPMRTVGMVAKLSVLADRLDGEYLYFGFNGDEPLDEVDESNEALRLGEKFINECTLPGTDFTVLNPLAGADSGEVIELGSKYGVDWKASCSCCEPGEGHCWECTSCLDRIKGFEDAGIEDPLRS